MRFEFEQSVGAPAARVVRAYSSAEFYEALGAMPNLGVREVLERTVDGDDVTLRVRFAFTGDVSGAVRAVVDPAKLTWVTVTTVRTAEQRAQFEMLPDFYPDRLECHGTYRFEDGGASTRQLMAGDLVVRVPLVGRSAERAIISGFRQNLADQAHLLETWDG